MDLLKAGALAKKKGGGATNVEDVFSTYLYTGNGSTQTITNGIDLAGKGGMVWIKDRSVARGHRIVDTLRGTNEFLSSDTTTGETTVTTGVTAFNSDGFALGLNADYNEGAETYASWTFRKKEKFFDIVTWTGDGTVRNIPHNLGSAVGMILVKPTINSAWIVYHKNGAATTYSGAETYGVLSETNSWTDSAAPWNNTEPTDAVFTTTGSSTNVSGRPYVAYLFADNSAEDAEEQMIKCGSCVINSADAVVDLGWQPQFVLIKEYNVGGSWKIVDTMRGMGVNREANQGTLLYANTSNAEETNNGPVLTPSGFAFPYAGGNATANGTAFIYMAVRGPMMAEPESATDVFAVAAGDGASPPYEPGFRVDMALQKVLTSGDGVYLSRLAQGEQIWPSATNAHGAASWAKFDYMDGWNSANLGSTQYSWMWKRAKGFFDEVLYVGNATPSVGHRSNVPHALGVPPEMLMLKRRDSTSEWQVFHKTAGVGYLNLTNAFTSNASTVIADYVTSTTFSIGSWVSEWNNNVSGSTYLVALFATLDGISKVGSYTGNGSYQTIDCGFAAGSRFILIKRTDATGDWYYWDSVRGIVAGNDPHLSLNNGLAQVTTDDSVDPENSGFIVNQNSATNINVTSATYIFYAIA